MVRIDETPYIPHNGFVEDSVPNSGGNISKLSEEVGEEPLEIGFLAAQRRAARRIRLGRSFSMA